MMDIRVHNVPFVKKKHGCDVCLVTCCLVKWLGVLGKRKTHPDITGVKLHLATFGCSLISGGITTAGNSPCFVFADFLPNTTSK